VKTFLIIAIVAVVAVIILAMRRGGATVTQITQRRVNRDGEGEE
jgi:hypothetical protein